jgi:hypothetical protein
MTAIASSLDDLLRGRSLTRTARLELASWAGWLVLCGCLYGGVMGAFGGVSGERIWQVIYSAVKVPLLLGVTFLLTVPSFFVLNTILGLRADFPAVWQALLRTQSVSAALLASMTPYTIVWYLTSGNYDEAILFNALIFGVASISAQILLWRAYRPLVARNPRHRILLRGWIAVYAFVGIQMGWVLRPFIGDPSEPTQFFREGAWGNAYVVVSQMIVDIFRDWLH